MCQQEIGLRGDYTLVSYALNFVQAEKTYDHFILNYIVTGSLAAISPSMFTKQFYLIDL